MAALVCWASGLLQVIPEKDVDHTPAGPVVITTGTADRLQSMVAAHGELREHGEWVVPGTRDVETFGREVSAVHMERMDLVIEFGKKIANARLKQKGLKHLVAAKGGA